MRADLIAYLLGYLRVQVRGGRLEDLVNRMAENRFHVRDIARRDGNTAEMILVIRDFFRLRPLLKQTGCRIHVLERRGLPFVLDKLGRRKFFAAGVIVFIIGLYVLSSLVWQIKVEGNQQIPTADVLAAAEKLGIHPWQWKFKLGDTDKIADELERSLPDATWVGFSIDGTIARIKVVEASKPKPEALSSPRNLIAGSDAVVTDIFVENGKPMVKPNEHVRKGEVLVSGIIGSEGHSSAVVAKGTVRGLVWHEYQITVPLTEKWKTFTGRTRDVRYLVLGNHAVQISGFGKNPFHKYDTELLSSRELQWRGRELPLGWMQERRLEVNFVEQTLSEAQAVQLGLKEAEDNLVLKKALDAQVRKSEVLQQKVQDGILHMKVLLEADEVISVEQPLVYLNGDAGT